MSSGYALVPQAPAWNALLRRSCKLAGRAEAESTLSVAGSAKRGSFAVARFPSGSLGTRPILPLQIQFHLHRVPIDRAGFAEAEILGERRRPGRFSDPHADELLDTAFPGDSDQPFQQMMAQSLTLPGVATTTANSAERVAGSGNSGHAEQIRVPSASCRSATSAIDRE